MSKPYWPGAPGLRQIPFGKLFTRLDRPVPAGAGIVTAYTDGAVTLRSNRAEKRYHEAANLSTYQGVVEGDFVVHGLDIMRGSVGVADSDGAMSPVCAVCKPGPLVNARFVAYVMRNQAHHDFPKALARGIRDGGADFRRWETLAEFPIPVPPLPEQRAIAVYLDRETAEIDALMAEQERLIATLRERRAAVIDHATADGNAPAVALRRLNPFVTSGSRGWGAYYADEGERFVRIGNLSRTGLGLRGEVQHVALPVGNTEGERTRLRHGDLMLSITAYLGSVAVVEDPDWYEAFTSQHVALCRFPSVAEVNTRYIGYALLAKPGQDQLAMSSSGGTKEGLSLDDVRAIRIPLPPLDEQRRIADYLDEQTSAIDALIAETERFIAVSEERRSALITAAVTGQIDCTHLIDTHEGATA